MSRNETMNRNKFRNILRYVRLDIDDQAIRSQQRFTDKFKAISELCKSLMLNGQETYKLAI